MTTASQPDIQYHPDVERYHERSQHRKDTEDLCKDLPAGFPSQLKSPLVWHGKDVETRSSDWTYCFSQEQLVEIDAALAHFKYYDPDTKCHSPATFTDRYNFHSFGSTNQLR